MNIYEIGLYIAYAMLVIGVLVLLIGMVRGILNDKSSGIQALVGIAFILIVFGIGYATASGDLTEKAIADGISGSEMKMYDAGLKTLYVLVVGGILALFGDITKSIIQGG
ncbi:MAG: hypothetical protein HKN92_07090 [Chitinophagales bacterium]|nr:hypothetical protein [Chitinophagales bacterium]